MILILALTLSATSYAQKLADSTKLRLKVESLIRLRNDQMVDHPNYSLHHTDVETQTRNLRFLDNLGWILEITKRYGCFPTAKLLYANDSMDKNPNTEWQLLVPTTFTHIFQTYPALMLDKDVVHAIAIALKKKQLKKEHLAHGVRTYRHSRPNRSEEQKINHAMKEWGMELFTETDFQ